VQRVPVGRFGEAGSDDPTWESLRLPPPWPRVVGALGPGARPRDVQARALAGGGILRDRRNLVVTAPTNGGKTLVALLALLEAVARGRRAVLVEPLRALAQEKAAELQARAGALAAALGRPLRVSLSTGDHRLERETFRSPPPGGELLVATPERLDAILRDPAHDPWLATVDAVCLDEAHLLASPRRGPVMEYLLTALLAEPAPPRIVLASATLGGTDPLARWLAPCDVVASAVRRPPVAIELAALEGAERADDVVLALAREALRDGERSLLVFVYQTRAAEALARTLAAALGAAAGTVGALAYHAQLAREARAAVRAAFAEGTSRCVVTTTALALGVNLPATDVIVRDTVFPGAGELAPGELLQMAGRAGRGDRAGRATILRHGPERRSAAALASQLCRAPAAELRSHLAPGCGGSAPQAAERVAAFLARRGARGASRADVAGFFARTLAGPDALAAVRAGVGWLLDAGRALAWRDEQGDLRLTALGLAATRSTFPLPAAAGAARLLRDVLELEPDDALLGAWRPLDTLLLVQLLAARAPRLRRSGDALAARVDAWMDAHPAQASIVFGRFLRGGRSPARADEVLGSLGVGEEGPGSERPLAGDAARRAAQAAVARAVILLERGRGVPAERLEEEWPLDPAPGGEERWRDDTLWLLTGLAAILDVRAFQHHLRGRCAAGAERLARVARLLRGLRLQALELREAVESCSPLGAALRSLRGDGAGARRGPGVRAIRRLEAAGLLSWRDLDGLGEDAARRLGIAPEQVRLVAAHLRAARRPSTPPP
jgi:superfamily II DNA/RNA helicase